MPETSSVCLHFHNHLFSSCSRKKYCRRIPFKLGGIGILCAVGFLVLLLKIRDKTSKDRIERLSQNADDVSNLDEYRVRCCSWESQQAQLPNLSRLTWPPDPVSPIPAGASPGRRPAVFEPIMSRGQKKLFRTLLHVFTKLMFDNGMGNQFMIYGGTLLGSYRHHDFIPWDDDMDVIVNLSLRSKVRKLLTQLSPKYELVPAGRLDKFYARLLNATESKQDVELSRPVKQWGWPFIDIFYFYTDGSHMLEYNDEGPPEVTVPLSSIFPLYFRPFGKEWYPAPRDTHRYVIVTYGSTTSCAQPGFSHVDETMGKSGSMTCEDLLSRYAFVKLDHTNVDFWHAGAKREMRRSVEQLIQRTQSGHLKTIHSIPLAIAYSNF